MEKTITDTSTNADKEFIVAGCKPWNRRVFDEVITGYPGEWIYVSEPEQLAKALAYCRPDYIFFLHWSWIVPKEVIHKYECVCFHMADVPYGRNRSPFRNLIIRGHRKTKLTALRMIEELDAGSVYFKEDLSLEGNAERFIFEPHTCLRR